MNVFLVERAYTFPTSFGRGIDQIHPSNSLFMRELVKHFLVRSEIEIKHQLICGLLMFDLNVKVSCTNFFWPVFFTPILIQVS